MSPRCPLLESVDARFRVVCVEIDMRDMIHAGQCWAMICPSCEPIHRFMRTAQQRFNASVLKIAHPAGKPQPTRFIGKREAETNALNSAGDKQSA